MRRLLPVSPPYFRLPTCAGAMLCAGHTTLGSRGPQPTSLTREACLQSVPATEERKKMVQPPHKTSLLIALALLACVLLGACQSECPPGRAKVDGFCITPDSGLTGIRWPSDAEAPQVGDAGLQLGIDGSCEPGMYIRRIHPDGTLECAAGVEQDPMRPGTNCPEGEYVRGFSEDGGVLCESIPLAKASVDAGSPVIEGSCTDGGYIQEVDEEGNVICGTPAEASLDCETETEKFTVSPGNFTWVDTTCARSGDVVVSGGIEFDWGTGDVGSQHVRESYPISNTAWRCTYNNDGTSNTDVLCYARCCRLR